MCSAVMNDVTSRGDGELEGVSENIACRTVVDEGVRARENVCLREDEKEAGDGGRTCCVGDDGVPLRKGVEFADAALPPLFFLLLNGRRNDQSDSNWTDSNSDESAE